MSWKEKLALFGPGIIWAAAAIGSGETIIATKVGAEYGYLFIWALWVGLWFKYWTQRGILELSLIKQKPVVELWHNTRLGKLISSFWLIFYLLETMGIAGLIGLMASATHFIFPLLSIQIWGVVLVLTIVLLAYFQNYKSFEKLMIILASLLVIGTIGVVFLSRPNPAEIFNWGIPTSIAAWLVLISLMGWGAGSGAELMLPYSWWSSEKGYEGFKINKKKANEEDTKKIKGWLRIANLDIITGYIITGLIASCFIIAGAAVLRPKGIVVGGIAVIEQISSIFTGIYGPWVLIIFFIAILAAIYSTALGFIDGARIVIANLLRMLFNRKKVEIGNIRRNMWYRLSLIVFAGIPLIIFLGFEEPA